MLKELLFEGYFPDLRHLTLPLRSFVVLWTTGVIPMLLTAIGRGLAYPTK
jgi:hypothetical protein